MSALPGGPEWRFCNSDAIIPSIHDSLLLFHSPKIDLRVGDLLRDKRDDLKQWMDDDAPFTRNVGKCWEAESSQWLDLGVSVGIGSGKGSGERKSRSCVKISCSSLRADSLSRNEVHPSSRSAILTPFS